MEIGKKHIGRTFINACDENQKLVIDGDGFGKFYVHDRSVAVWIDEDAFKSFN